MVSQLLGSAVLPVPEPTSEWLLSEVSRLLDTATVSAREDGGFGWLDAAGRVDVDRGRPLWITTRMTHCFALGTLIGRDGDAALVDHGVRALQTVFRDAEHGGWFGQLDGSGPDAQPADGTKGAYGHAFVVLAGASATVAGRPGGRELLDAALAVQEQHFWDDAAGAVVEEWDRDWTTAEAYRGANANMHTVEAYLAAADATGNGLWRDRALRIAARIVDSGARAHNWRLPEHFDEEWRELPDYNVDEPAHPFRPYGVTPGHGLEWARLLLHLDASLRADGLEPPLWLLEAARGLFDRALADGWDDTFGGIAYTTAWDGVPVVEQHFHWVVCEGIAAAVALQAATGEQSYRDWYERLWAYARRTFLAEGTPGWLHEANRDGTPSTRTWTGRPDVYHALQACLIPFLPLTPTFAKALATR